MMILSSGNSMNKRRRSSSVTTISDESDEFATPDREISPLVGPEGVDGSTTSNTSTTTPTTILVSSSSGRKRKKLDPVSLCLVLPEKLKHFRRTDEI